MARRPQKPEHPICHPERPVYSRSLCRPCYDKARWTGQAPRTATGEARAIIEDIAGKIPRAVRKAPGESQYIRTAIPRVADHVAAVMVKNCLDTEQAVAELKPDLSPYEAAQTANKLDNDPRVQQAVQKQLQKRGLDEKSKDHFVDLLWRYAESEKPNDEKRQLQSLRILGKAFIADHVEISKPEVLRFSGFEEEVKRMFDGNDPREQRPDLDS
jgi:hypothetical protein